MCDDGFLIPSSGGTHYVVPKGSYIAASHIVPHYDAISYTSPRDFCPQRFNMAYPDDYTLTTFRSSQ